MTDLHEAAYRALLHNLQRGPAPAYTGLKEYVYVCPAHGIYPHQWLWDSCFHAIVMARFDSELAKAELRTLLAGARPDGMVPQVISWAFLDRESPLGRAQKWLYERSHFAHLTQPPVLAIALEEIFRHSEDYRFLYEVLPATKKHYDYLASERDPDGDGLLSIILPIESGMDHSPAFDMALGFSSPTAWHHQWASLRLTLDYLRQGWDTKRILEAGPFCVEDLAFNSFYALGLHSLARLCRRLGDEIGAQAYQSRAEKTEQAVLARCYDEETGLFYSLSGTQEEPLRTPTVASLLPLALPTLPESVVNSVIERHLLDEHSFWPEYPVPSVSLAHPLFSPNSDALTQKGNLLTWLGNQIRKHHLIWRGPTWVNTNWFLARGLRRRGYSEIADALTIKTADMVRQSGFWEYYNPFTGKGQGAEHFGWSTLVVDMLDEATSPVSTRSFPTVAGKASEERAVTAVLSPQTALQP